MRRPSFAQAMPGSALLRLPQWWLGVMRAPATAACLLVGSIAAPWGHGGESAPRPTPEVVRGVQPITAPTVAALTARAGVISGATASTLATSLPRTLLDRVVIIEQSDRRHVDDPDRAQAPPLLDGRPLTRQEQLDRAMLAAPFIDQAMALAELPEYRLYRAALLREAQWRAHLLMVALTRFCIDEEEPARAATTGPMIERGPRARAFIDTNSSTFALRQHYRRLARRLVGSIRQEILPYCATDPQDGFRGLPYVGTPDVGGAVGAVKYAVLAMEQMTPARIWPLHRFADCVHIIDETGARSVRLSPTATSAGRLRLASVQPSPVKTHAELMREHDLVMEWSRMAFRFHLQSLAVALDGDEAEIRLAKRHLMHLPEAAAIVRYAAARHRLGVIGDERARLAPARPGTPRSGFPQYRPPPQAACAIDPAADQDSE